MKILEGLQRVQEGELPSHWASEISAWCSIEQLTPRIQEGLSTSRARELPVPGLRRSPWGFNQVAGAEDPEGSLVL